MFQKAGAVGLYVLNHTRRVGGLEKKARASSLRHVKADLHSHPNILHEADLQHTLDLLVQHNIDMYAVTQHNASEDREGDLENVKTLLDAHGRPYDDHVSHITVAHKDKTITLLNAYEYRVSVPYSRDQHHMVSVNVPSSFRRLEAGMPLEDVAQATHEAGGIVLFPHPLVMDRGERARCVITRFRTATEEEQEEIAYRYFGNDSPVDAIDLTASSVAHFTRTNKMVLEQTPMKAIIASSDTHAANRFARGAIGTAYTILAVGTDRGNDFGQRLRDSILAPVGYKLNYISAPRWAAVFT